QRGSLIVCCRTFVLCALNPRRENLRSTTLTSRNILPETCVSIIDLLSGNSRLVKIAAGDLIFAQGDRGEVMYVVAEGQAQILIDGKAVETVAAGGIVG